MTETKDKYVDWLELSNKLKKTKADELKMRKELCADIFGMTPAPAKKKFVTESGYEVKAESNVNHKLDKDVVNQLFKDFTDADKNALKFIPDLVMKFYKTLPEDSILHEAVTVNPSTPTLKVEKIVKI